MNTPELISYIKIRLSSGVSSEKIKSELLASHWAVGDINEALKLAIQPSTNSDTPPLLPHSPLPPAMDIIREAIDRFKEKPQLYGGIIIIPGILNFFVSNAVSFIPTSIQQQTPLPYMMVGVLVGILTNIIGSVGALALLIGIRDISTSTSIGNAYKKALRLLISYWWVLFLSGIIALGGTLLFIIPGIILAIQFSFVEYALIFDNDYGMKALQKSKKIISGYVLSVGWRGFVLAIVCLLFSLPSFAVAALVKSLHLLQIPSQLITLLTASITTPIAIIAESIIYTSIKARKTSEELTIIEPTPKKYGIFGCLGLLFPISLVVLMVIGALFGIKSYQSLNISRDSGQNNTVQISGNNTPTPTLYPR